MFDSAVFAFVFRGADLLAINADQNMPYDICEEDSTLQFIEQAMAKKGKLAWIITLTVVVQSAFYVVI